MKIGIVDTLIGILWAAIASLGGLVYSTKSSDINENAEKIDENRSDIQDIKEIQRKQASALFGSDLSDRDDGEISDIWTMLENIESQVEGIGRNQREIVRQLDNVSMQDIDHPGDD